MTRLFGLTVAGGLSSENQVFARLLAERDERYEALVVVHDVSGGGEGIAHDFSVLAKSPTVPVDTGWRPNSWSRRGNPRRAPMAVRYRHRVDRIIAAANGFDPGVVYSSQQHYDCRAASKVARTLAVPQIVHLHYTVGPWLRRDVVRQLRVTDRVVTVSDFVRRQAISHGVPEERIQTIHNAIAAHVRPSPDKTEALYEELLVPKDHYVYGLVARADPGKGQFDAIAAFERVARARDDVSLVLVGSGRLERKIRARAERSPASDRIVVAGQRSDVPALLSIFDALVHPASQDPCPLAVLEAMAASLPVVAYDDGGLPELVEPGTTGLLVGHGDVGALADGMLALHDDVTMSRALGVAATRRVASHFAPARAGAKFADLVTSVA